MSIHHHAFHCKVRSHTNLSVCSISIQKCLHKCLHHSGTPNKSLGFSQPPRENIQLIITSIFLEICQYLYLDNLYTRNLDIHFANAISGITLDNSSYLLMVMFLVFTYSLCLTKLMFDKPYHCTKTTSQKIC